MAKKSKEKHADELAYLRDWNLTVAKHVGGAGFPGALAMEERIINEAYDRADIRGLRIITKDKIEMTRLAPPEKRERLDKLLRSQFGAGLEDEDHKYDEKISKILKRGRIENEDECRLLLVHADEIYADQSKRDELTAINCLLGAFEGGEPQ